MYTRGLHQIISRKQQFVLLHYNSLHLGKQSLSHLNGSNNITHTKHWHFYIGRFKRKQKLESENKRKVTERGKRQEVKKKRLVNFKHIYL